MYGNHSPEDIRVSRLFSGTSDSVRLSLLIRFSPPLSWMSTASEGNSRC